MCYVYIYIYRERERNTDMCNGEELADRRMGSWRASRAADGGDWRNWPEVAVKAPISQTRNKYLNLFSIIMMSVRQWQTNRKMKEIDTWAWAKINTIDHSQVSKLQLRVEVETMFHSLGTGSIREKGHLLTQRKQGRIQTRTRMLTFTEKYQSMNLIVILSIGLHSGRRKRGSIEQMLRHVERKSIRRKTSTRRRN